MTPTLHARLATPALLAVLTGSAAAQILCGPPTWSYGGAQAGEQMGFAVARAGDVNGDGYEDLVIGSPYRALGILTHEPGAAFLFLGSPYGPSPTPDWLVTGNGNEWLGYSVAAAGDVDGDGFGDVLLGAPRSSATGTAAGAVYLFRGGASGLAATPSWTLLGTGAGGNLGYSVAGAGDVNGDGYGDVVVGAPYAGASVAGEVSIFLGSSGGLSTTPAWVGGGTTGGNQIGASVGCAGDVDGDGYDEVVYGAPGHTSSSGLVAIVAGSASGPAGVVKVYNGAAGSRLGRSVAGAGDVNGDGFDDVLLGAPDEQVNKGSAQLFLGSAGGLAAIASFTVTGADGDACGYAVTAAGDVDGDGYDDVLVGSPGRLSDRGRAALYRGQASGVPVLGVNVDGFQLGQRLGQSLAGVPGLTGDALSDLVVGSPQASGVVNQEGRVDVYFGRLAETSYCTAGISASGCQATLAVFGTASATSGFGFDVFAIGVEGAKDGLFFFGQNGRQAAPWGNGTSLMCVVPPVKRGGTLSGTGQNGACDNYFAQELNSRWCPACPKASQAPVPGVPLQIQLWYRDPLNTSNQSTSLSDAIEVGVCP